MGKEEFSQERKLIFSIRLIWRAFYAHFVSIGFTILKLMQISYKAELLLLMLKRIHLFARGVLLIKKLEIEETKTA